jgi:hypothetical protein
MSENNGASYFSKFSEDDILASLQYLLEEGFISLYEDDNGELFVKINDEDITEDDK